jgi:broad specificity phosphatase PhoE
MSTLTLVRHAQASFFADDYDKLSELGESQARKLGEYFVKTRQTFSEVYVGPAVRHRRTAELVGEVMSNAGQPWPEIVVLEGLNEHAADLLLNQFARDPSSCPSELAGLVAEYKRATSREEIQKGFQKLFEAIVHHWLEERVASPEVGTWVGFRGSVNDAMDRMTTNKPAGSSILAVGSTGSITVALQYALQTSDRIALQMGWRLRNCALSRFIFSTGRITLDTFNNLSHFDDMKLVTYR